MLVSRRDTALQCISRQSELDAFVCLPLLCDPCSARKRLKVSQMADAAVGVVDPPCLLYRPKVCLL